MKEIVAEIAVRADPVAARETAITEAEAAGFRVRRNGEWNATAKRGNKALKNAIGMTGLAAYAEMDIQIRQGQSGGTLVDLLQDRKGYVKRGGAVRGARSSGYFEEALRRMAERFQSEGVLVSVNQVQ